MNMRVRKTNYEILKLTIKSDDLVWEFRVYPYISNNLFFIQKILYKVHLDDGCH